MEIYSKSGRITPAEDKTNIRLDFTVPDGTKKLIVKYHYSPKDVEDEKVACQLIYNGMQKYNMDVANVTSFMPVHNLVTLSFDECGKYRGACHRQPNDQTVVIADKDSTPGIFNRPIKAGVWDVVLNVHFAGCDIDYTINVEVE